MGATQLPIAAAYSPYLQTGLISPLMDATGGVGGHTAPAAPAPPTPTQQQIAAKRNEVRQTGGQLVFIIIFIFIYLTYIALYLFSSFVLDKLFYFSYYIVFFGDH